MCGFHQCVACGGQDRISGERLGVSRSFRPDACKGKQALGLQTIIMRDFIGTGFLPFDEPVRRYQTAAHFKGVPETGFLVHRFRASVDQAFILLFAPGRDQPPNHRQKIHLVCSLPYNRGLLTGGDVVAWAMLHRHPEMREKIADGFHGFRQCVSSAHNGNESWGLLSEMWSRNR